MNNYIFKGKLRAYICKECLDGLANVQVRLYRHRGDQDAPGLVVAAPKHTFLVLSDDDVKAKDQYLIAEARTDQNGEFIFQINAEKNNYSGEAFEVDVRMTSVPGRDPDAKPIPMQFTITSLKPEWTQQGDIMVAAYWDYIISARYWCHLLAYFDLWVICGRFVTCEGEKPLPGAIIRAFDADWLQHDELGQATTDFNGRFRIYYTSAAFKKTPFSPWINIELTGGPDLFFQAEYGGSLVVNESSSEGRQPGRENVGHCACIELCADLAPPDQDEIPHWERVEDLEVDTDFSPEGYGGASSLVMHDCIDLRGNMPLKNVANGKALKYRFLIGAWTWPGAEDPAVMPSNAPADADLVAVKSICATKVGYIYYADGNGDPRSAPVIIKSSDLDGDGCVTLLGTDVTVDMHDGTTAVKTVDEHNFVGAYLLMALNSTAYTPAPYDVNQNLGLVAAGTAVAVADRAPIRRFKLRFQVYDFDDLAVDKVSDNKTLNALVIDNSPVKYALNLAELAGDLCNKITNDVHIRYTIDHPHLSYFKVTIENNGGMVHNAPPLPDGSFSGNFFFRGGESGVAGFPVIVAGDPVCAYVVKLSWQTRHYHHDTRWISTYTQILYCK